VSSAAVQGRRPVLDETYDYDLRSPYARSKALGEVALRDASSDGTQPRVYRATSVQAVERSITQTLLRLAHAPIVPMAGAGDHPLPLSLLDNTAAAIVHTAAAEEVGAVVVHPWEGITTERFFTLVNPEVRLRRLPPGALSAMNELLWAVAPRSSLAAAMAKRADLMISGQRSTTGELTRTGFVPPIGDEGYAELGHMWRRTREAA
jgi:UDP-glucose 4-epimerase